MGVQDPRFVMADASVRSGREGGAEAMADGETLGELYRSQREPLFRLAFLLVGNDADAEELVQDVFAQLARRRIVPDNPAAYLRRSIVNRVNSHFRGATQDAAGSTITTEAER